MIVCTKCSTQNEDDDEFCGGCGEFLEWAGQKVEADAPEEAVAEEAVAEEAAAEVDLVAEEAADEATVEAEAEAILAEETALIEMSEAPVAATAAATSPPPPPAPTSPPPVPAPAAAGSPPAPGAEVTTRTPSLRTPPQPVETGATEPAAAAPPPAAPKAETPAPARPTTPGPSAPTAAPPPKAAARPRPAAAPVAREPQPDDKVCAECGADNAAQRKFCRGCGASLVAAPPPVVKEEKPPPKLVDKVIGKKEQGPMAAGERPPPKKSKANLTKPLAIGAVLVVGAAALLFRGTLTDKATEIRQTVAPGFDPVNPTAAAATSEVAEHPAAHAIDTGSNTFWAEGAEGDGTGQSITVNFPAAFALGKVGVFPGRNGEEFLAHPRPKDIHFELLDGAGASVGSGDATLEDVADLQLVDVTGNGVQAVRIEIRSVYPGQSGQEAAITDLQFFTAS